ncbi:hypothetical protein [Bradyrhizobium sp. S3.2.6]|uniref:hypothetical protein n=1 Tax=Bradyrhizobium sp. S3.2.6 TaxID=3156428 RepID=UPI003396AA62
MLYFVPVDPNASRVRMLQTRLTLAVITLWVILASFYEIATIGNGLRTSNGKGHGCEHD